MGRRGLVLISLLLGCPVVALALSGPDPAAALAAAAQQLRHRFEERRAPEGPPVTLEAMLEDALRQNPELVALRAEAEAARPRPARERSLPPPTIEAQIWQWPIATLNPLATNMYMFMLGQDVPGAGKRDLRAALAQKEAELADTAVAVRARAILGRVRRLYGELFYARKAIELHLASVDLLRQLAEISQARYATGLVSQQDVLKAIVELSKRHDDLVRLDERAELAQAELNALLDRPLDAPLGPLAEPQERVLLASVAELERLAVDHQPELRAAQLAIERAETALALAEREGKPDLFFQGGYFLMPRHGDAWTLRAGLTWPTAPWARGGLASRRAEAAAALAAARLRRHQMETALRLAVQEAFVRVKTAEQRAALLRTSIVPPSRQALEVSRVAYQADRVDFLALIDNQRVLLDVQLAYYRAVADLEEALADLEQAVGTALPPGAIHVVQPSGGR